MHVHVHGHGHGHGHVHVCMCSAVRMHVCMCLGVKSYLRYEQPKMRPQPRIRWPTVRLERRVWPKQREVDRAKRARERVVQQPTRGGLQEGRCARCAGGGLAVDASIIEETHIGPLARVEGFGGIWEEDASSGRCAASRRPRAACRITCRAAYRAIRSQQSQVTA